MMKGWKQRLVGGIALTAAIVLGAHTVVVGRIASQARVVVGGGACDSHR